MLTAAQIAHFETFGFLALRGLFSQNETDSIRRESDDVLAQDRSGRPFTGETRQCIIPFFEKSPLLTDLLEDDSVYGIAESLLGPDFILMSTEGNLFVGATEWHGGDPCIPLRNIKIAWCLDSVMADTGSLRVIPGSHRRGEFHDSLRSSLHSKDGVVRANDFGVEGPALPSFAIESSPGDVVVFTEDVYHASFGGRAGRRMHAIMFSEAVRTEEQEAYLRQSYKESNYTWHPDDSLVNSDRPRLRGMVSTLVELRFESSKL